MRILLVGDYAPDPRLGSTKVYYKLADAMRALGHECDVALSDTLGTWPGNSRLRLAAGPVLGLRAIQRALRTNHYDIVDVASADGWMFGALQRLRAGSRTSFVARSHGIEHLNYQRMLDDSARGIRAKAWYRRAWHPAMRLPQVAAAARIASRLIVGNPADAAFAIERGWKTAAAVDVIPHGVSAVFLDPTHATTGTRGQGILFCGSWDHVKGIAYLTAAMSELAKRGVRIPLTVAGAGVPENVVMEAFASNVRPLVTVLPRMEEEDLMDVYRTHDLLAFPSTYEGFGMVLLEAMSQGLPVVSTPVGAALTFVQHEKNGLIVPPRSATALADALARLAGDAALAGRLGQAGRESVGNCSWEVAAGRTLECYTAARATSQPHQDGPITDA